MRGLEAVLFLADEPVAAETLAEVVEAELDAVQLAVEELAERYHAEGRGIEIRHLAGGWRMYTSPAARAFVERWALAGRTGRLTHAALETLAVIAYKQPIGRQEIGDIRGVNADGAVRSLVARGLVQEVDRDPGPGQAALFGTTPLLLERLGLSSLDELPPLTEFLPEAPAPDEPELGALKEIRRRLAAGGELPTRSGIRSGGADVLPSGAATEAPDDELPPPAAPVGAVRTDEDMEGLTDRLEQVARNAVERLRASVEAQEQVLGEGQEQALDEGEEPGMDEAEPTPVDDGPEPGGGQGAEPDDEQAETSDGFGGDEARGG